MTRSLLPRIRRRKGLLACTDSLPPKRPPCFTIMQALSSSSSSLAKPVSAKKGKGVARPRPTAARQPTGSSGFSPSFPALDEDPSGLQLEGWLALEDESGSLLRRFELQRRAVLILGRAS